MTRDSRRGVPSPVFLAALFAIMLPAAATPVWAQDLNELYRYPLAIGGSYRTNTPLGSDATSIAAQDIQGTVRLTWRNDARWGWVFQPGVQIVGDSGGTRSDAWDHTRYTLGFGAEWRNRINKGVGFGARLYGGPALTVFPSLVTNEAGEAEGKTTLDAALGFDLMGTVNPSFNLSFDIGPTIRFQHNLGRYLDAYGTLDRYDGVSVGFGFAVNYRVGRDPDLYQQDFRALRIGHTDPGPVFAAMQSVYTQTPLTTITVENTEDDTIEDISVSFFQAGFMDSPTTGGTLATLEPGASAEIPVYASFNRAVFETNGITPLNGEAVVSYTYNRRGVEQTYSIAYDLHDRNALTWDDDRKVAAFITPQDSAIRNYGSYIRQAHREATNPFVSENLQFAIQAYNALAELGILYQVDPTSPFTQVQEDTFVVDSISLPRETLTRLTGDCDDITVLYNTLLQSVGIETAFVTTPGHIYSAVNTGVASGDYRSVHPDRSMTLDIDGQLWVLVEITLIGRAGFLEAWSTGVAEFARYEDDTRSRGFYRTSQAQEVFRPVALRETDLGLQYGSETAITQRFGRDMDQLAGVILRPYEEAARDSGTARDWNAYGIAAAQFGASRQAREAFTQVLRIDPDYVNARLNLGSLAFLEEDYRAALDAFEAAERVAAEGGRIRDSLRTNLLLNLSKTHYALENYEDARDYYEMVQQVNADEAARFSYLGAGGGAGGSIGDGDESGGTGIAAADEGGDLSAGIGRASSAASAEPILFFAD